MVLILNQNNWLGLIGILIRTFNINSLMKYLNLVAICFSLIQIRAQYVSISGSIINFHNQLQVEDLSEIGWKIFGVFDILF
jgi:hypothetical protein